MIRGLIALLASAATLAPTLAEADEPLPCAEDCAAEVASGEDKATGAVPHWTATVTGGYAGRSGGADGDFQIATLGRQLGRAYLRAGFTRFRSTLRQDDMAQPSTYLVGTLGAGANIANWVIDADASLGRQDYGPIALGGVTRASTGASGSPYRAANLSVGKVGSLGLGWYLTPALGLGWSHGRLLRPAPFGRGGSDFETDEQAWTISTTMRIDHAWGQDGRHFAGLVLAQRWTDNALSEMVPRTSFTPGASGADGLPFNVVRRADNWQEATLVGNVRLSQRLWLDTTLGRTFGALGGNTITASAGLRLGF